MSQKISPKEIKNLIKKNYNLDVKDVRFLWSGFQSSAYKVEAKEGLFSAKIFREKKVKSDLIFEFAVMDFLHQKGLPIQKPLQTKKKNLGLKLNSNRILCLYRFLKGEYPKKFSPSLIFETGKTLAKFHQIGVLFPKESLKNSIAKRRTWSLEEEIKKFKKGFSTRDKIPESYWQKLILSEKFSLMEKALSKVSDFKKKNPQLLEPNFLIHGDLHIDNLLFKDSEVTGILDFDNCSLGPQIWDLAVSSMTTVWIIRKEKFISPKIVWGNIKKGYTKILPIDFKDKDIFALMQLVVLRRLGDVIFYFKDYKDKAWWEVEIKKFFKNLLELET